MQRTVIETSQVEGIPVLTMVKEGAERCPVVFFVHGLMSNKRQGLAYGYELAASGFYFVGLDAPMHGDRFDERLVDLWSGRGDPIYPAGSRLDLFFLMHEIVVQIAEELEVLIEHFSENPGVDGRRIGLTGFSMGGLATFYAAANNPDVCVAVPIAGIPAFTARWRDVLLETSAYEKWAEAMGKVEAETARWMAFIEGIDPFENMASFHPRPLMMICGDLDTDTPKKYSVDLYRALKPLYAGCPERLRLNIHDEAGHQLTAAMIDDARDWFRRYLPGAEAV